MKCELYLVEQMTAEQWSETWPELRRYIVDAPSMILQQSLERKHFDPDQMDLMDRARRRRAKAELEMERRISRGDAA